MNSDTLEDSHLLYKSACPSCGSSDANAHYSDGHTHCFSCSAHVNGEGHEGTPASTHRPANFLKGESRALIARKITAETCQKWGYEICVDEYGNTSQVANYRDRVTGELIAQKVRAPNKQFSIRGSMKTKPLFGAHLWRDRGRMVVVTEGEIDALTVSQAQGNKWPVVSIPNGVQSARAAIAENLEWLLGFETVVLMFDDDQPGRDASAECAPLFPAGRCKIATIPGFKDASEACQAGKMDAVVNAIWEARDYRPAGILTLSDIRDAALNPPETGLPFWDQRLTAETYGRRLGELAFLGAGTGVGKTDWLMQQAVYDLTVLKERVGLFLLEQEPAETGKRLAGKHAKRRFHIPDGSWNQDELITALGDLGEDRLYLYNSAGAGFGATAWEYIRDRIRYLHHAYGVRLFYLDHLTALAAVEDDERRGLERICAEMGGLVKELRIHLCVISHLSTALGTPHEEGGRVQIKNFKGSRAIGFWGAMIFGLERNQQSEDRETANRTLFRILKDRNTGNATGLVLGLGYDRETGLLFPAEIPPSYPDANGSRSNLRPQTAEGYGF